MNREELKRLWFSLPPSTTVRKEIIVDINCGQVEVLSDGPDGYSSFKTNQGDNAFDYGEKLYRKKEYKEYKLIVK